jgi:hypothetical protein
MGVDILAITYEWNFHAVISTADIAAMHPAERQSAVT